MDVFTVGLADSSLLMATEIWAMITIDTGILQVSSRA